LLLQRLAPALVLTAEGGPDLPDGLPTARIDAPVLPRAHAADVLPGATYVIHTSGSTGTPKPVAVGRTALEHHLTATADRFALTSADRVLMFAQPSFDVALEEVLPTLHAGACLVIPEHEVPTGTELTELLAAARVTVANLPTSYFLATREELRPALREESWTPRLLVLGGERLPAETLRGILADTDATVLNAYGVTEAAITSTVHEVAREALAEGAEIPLGTELPGERVHVLDAHHRPLPDGAVGELAIAGPGLAEGYPGNAEVTAARFRTVDALGGERVYLTGDLGYRGLDGLLYFLGRRDNQVKLRGYRIELEEIEAAASAALGGRSCAVVLDAESPAAPRLVGFFEDGAGLSDVDEKALHTELSGRLPGALVPARWARLETMPTLAGGKPDRTVLTRRAVALDPAAPAAPGAGSSAGDAETVAVPDDTMTALLVNGWREVLGHNRFDTGSHFFHIGGHSLLAAELAAWLEPHLGARPPLKVLFRNPVLADQADALAATAPLSTES
ncbi:AMP-binding protein, partial [Streptomyces sp. YS-3]|uniref:AMP-binding protein n=1 Tax=Streptomyces sp. YS-3 TaxID=3381352 RepID=UPI0038629C90